MANSSKRDNSESEIIRLQRQCTASLAWINRNINRFSPWQKPGLTDAGIKAFAELSLLLMYLDRRESGLFSRRLPPNGTLSELKSFVVGHCENSAYAETIRKRPAQGYYLLLPYLMLRSSGYRSPYYEDTIKRLRRWGYLAPIEVVPYRRLDQQYVFWKSGLLRTEPSWHRLYKKTVLGHNTNLAYIDKETAYAITHTVFYLTDLGDRPSPLNPAENKRVTKIVDCMLFHYWRLAHWDLVGELLINLDCLNDRESLFYHGASNAFSDACRNDGSVPADQIAERKLLLSEASESEETVFWLCYHTTLLSVLYCSVALNRLDENVIDVASKTEKGRSASAALA